jgi:hypothetical protein
MSTALASTQISYDPGQSKDPELVQRILDALSAYAPSIDSILVEGEKMVVSLRMSGQVTVQLDPPGEDLSVPCWRSYLIGTLVAQVEDILLPGYHGLSATPFTEPLVPEYAKGTKFYRVTDFKDALGTPFIILISTHPSTRTRAYVVVTKVNGKDQVTIWGFTPWFNHDMLIHVKMLPAPDLVPLLEA